MTNCRHAGSHEEWQFVRILALVTTGVCKNCLKGNLARLLVSSHTEAVGSMPAILVSNEALGNAASFTAVILSISQLCWWMRLPSYPG